VGLARVYSGCTFQCGEKNCKRNLHGKVVSAPPGRAGVNFKEIFLCLLGEIWRIGVVHLVVLACVLRATTEKGRQLFKEKSALPERILATLM